VAVRLLLDTNRYRDFCAGETGVARAVRRAEQVLLPFVVVGELRAGFACGTKAQRNEAVLTCFLAQPTVEILFADDATTHFYAQVFRQLREQGTPIPANDLWIAALAIQHGLALATRDQHFRHLPQVVVV
jgi:tRNA(fMet)-specific endonuclease VapC